MDKLAIYIENIEQLAADFRYYNDYKDYNKLLLELDSIIYWSKKAKKLIIKNMEDKNENRN